MASRRDGEGPEVAVSVCIVTGRRSRLLARCLESLAAQRDAPAWELRVLADGDPDVEAVVREHVPGAVVGRVQKALPGAARNFLIAEARGELLLFLDDDVVVKNDLLRRLVDLAGAHPEIAVFGGPNETPPWDSDFQRVQGAVLASIAGSGPVRRRYGVHPPGPADERFFTLCNLAIRRAAMLPFANDIVCAEENELLDRLARAGNPMRYDASLVVYHERRDTLRGFTAQMRKYGRGRGQLIARRPGTAQVAYLAPAALVVYLAVAVPAALLLAEPIALGPGVLYVLWVLAGGWKVGRTFGRRRVWPIASSLMVLLHVNYGIGVLWGFVERRRAVPASPRDSGVNNLAMPKQLTPERRRGEAGGGK